MKTRLFDRPYKETWCIRCGCQAGSATAGRLGLSIRTPLTYVPSGAQIQPACRHTCIHAQAHCDAQKCTYPVVTYSHRNSLLWRGHGIRPFQRSEVPTCARFLAAGPSTPTARGVDEVKSVPIDGENFRRMYWLRRRPRRATEAGWGRQAGQYAMADEGSGEGEGQDGV